MKLFLFLFLSLCFGNIHAQTEKSKALSVSLDARKIDYFFDLDFHFELHKFQIAAGLETGIIKTFFQQRFFPGIHAQVAYPIVNRSNFSLAPAIDLNYNLLKVQRQSNHPNIYQEYRLGYALKWGKKFQLIHSAGIGLIAEHAYGAFSQKYISAFDLGYSIKLGCLYEF